MKLPCTYCSAGQKVLLILVTACLTFLSVVAFADDGGPRKKHYKRYNAKVTKSSLRFNISTSYINSAGGHTAGYSANCSFGNYRHLFEGGMIMNTESSEFDGAHLRYKYYFIPNESSSSVYMQTSAIYHHNAPLKNKLNALMHEDEFLGNFETFNTIEFYAGIGYQQRLLDKFFADFSIGFGGYSRQLNSEKDNRSKSFVRYSDDQGIGVNIKVTLGYYLW